MAVTAAELEDAGIVAIVRSRETIDFLAVAEALAGGGIGAMEITLNTPRALVGIGDLRSSGPLGIKIGAGTILDGDDCRAAINAGAEFIVTPTLQTDSIAICRSRGIPIFCGCLTPTEALAAHRAGTDFIKLFPADTLGSAYVRALLAPLPFLRIAPTGGVTVANLASWFDAGCAAVAVGSGLVSKSIVAERDWAGLQRAAEQFAGKLHEIRGT